MYLYKIIDTEDNNAEIGDVIQFDDGICVVKYTNISYPEIYSSLEDVINMLNFNHVLESGKIVTIDLC